MKWTKKNAVRDNGYTLFLFFCAISLVVSISSVTYFRDDLFANRVLEILFSILTTFLNPLYILLFLFVPFYILFRILPRFLFKPFLFVLSGSFFTYLYVEWLVFNQFKFHTNSFVLRILQQPDALEVLGIGALEITLMSLAVLAGTAASWVMYRLISWSPLPVWVSRILRGKLRKLGLVLLLFVIFTADKTAYAWYLYTKNATVYLLANDIPLYIPAQAGTVFENLGLKVPESNKPSLKILKSRVKYPLKPYQTTVKDPKKLPNIILLMADALRPDMIDPEIMPVTHRFATEKSVRYHRHFSGSNGTTQALFTMFYGLPSRYMDFFSRAEVSPVFFDALLQNNYQLTLLSSKSLGWLGTDHLVFFRVKDYIQDDLHVNSITSDEMVTRRALKTIDNHSRQQDRPLFLMVFYDSTHLPHFTDKRYKKFLPDDPSLVFNVRSESDRMKGMNEYRNAANFVDDQFAKLLDRLERGGYMENSVIYITADHGSEKYEHGHWGHASAFTNEQLMVPSILHIPGGRPGNVNRLTSHADLTVTLMELMGETYDPGLHSLGQSLLDPSPRDYIIADGMANRVLIDGNYKIDYTPFEGISYYKVTDAEDNAIEDPDAVIDQYSPKILKMFDDFQKFLN